MQENIIFVFPGQGAQHIGMAADIFRDYAAARYTFEQVSDMSGRDMANICFNGPADVLNTPENTSLATFTHSVAIANIVAHEFGMPLYKVAYALAGHSAGQFAALYCAGSVSMQDAVSMLSARAAYMSRVSGGMACIIGLDKTQVTDIIAQAATTGFVQISNHNSRDQFIISGENKAIESALHLAQGAGAKLAKRLNVALPAHCLLMQPAADLMRVRLDSIQFESPKTNWFSNQTANVMNNPIDVKNALADQMVHGVRWFEIMQKFPEYKITRAYELGPGRVLTRLINKTPEANCIAAECNNSDAVRRMLNDVARNMITR